jgi:hypothetical protein
MASIKKRKEVKGPSSQMMTIEMLVGIIFQITRHIIRLNSNDSAHIFKILFTKYEVELVIFLYDS